MSRPSESSYAEEPENGVTDDPSPTTKKPSISHTKTNLTIETEYVHMLLELDTIDWVYNFLSSFANWTLLAGYLVIPGTFTTLQKSDTLKQGLQDNHTEKAILNTIQNPPLVAIACTFLGVGAGTMVYLFFKWKHNYFWIFNRLFVYGFPLYNGAWAIFELTDGH
jgi:hypothetical protein